MQKARWSTAVAAAALLALPVATFAQNPDPQTPQTPPAQQAQPPAAQVDAGAAKTHLTQARNALSALTALPEAAKLQGDARTQVSQLISNFNALINAQSEWRAAYAKVDADVTALLGPAAPPDQPVGTSGTNALDPAVRAKLVEFRTHLKAFEAAAGGDAIPPSAPADSTANPAAPAVAPPARPAGMDAADRAKPDAEANAAASADPRKELDAIAGILDASKTGALTKAQTAELRKHVEVLRALLTQK